MQGLLQSAASLGPRALGALTEPACSQWPIIAPGLLSPALTAALRLSSCPSNATDASSHSAVAAPWGCRALHASASARGSADAGALFPQQRPTSSSASLPATFASQRSPLHLDGSRGADPGESRYTAPYWIPEAVRKANKLPEVLFTDPWAPHDEPEIRRRHARLCYDLLLHSPRPLTAEQVRDAVNDHLREQQRHVSPPPPLLATTAYVKQLLEHMRRTRLLYGRKNPESMLSGGHPEHPRLYVALPYQAARFGNPTQLAEQDAARREKRVQQAFKRLERGKPPYAIHRRRAYFSLWQHELAQEALRGAGAAGAGLPPAAAISSS